MKWVVRDNLDPRGRRVLCLVHEGGLVAWLLNHGELWTGWRPKYGARNPLNLWADGMMLGLWCSREAAMACVSKVAVKRACGLKARKD